MNLHTQSEYFHAFEWLRAEAIKGNRHAMILIYRIEKLEKERRVKK